ncbi:multidrug efflux SMR transporter [Sulfurovum sp.]|uniref:DMT family transporter n=1 Tax=Sulfurovum sp. TaxID=1969726 RepID=UPI003562A2E8
MNTYIYLAIAIIAEVTATSTLKLSEEFTRPVPSLIVIVAFGVSLYFMTLTLRTLPVGVMYAFWSGFGIILVTISGLLFYRQVPDLPAIIGMLLIIVGVIIINVYSKVSVL